MIRKNGELVFRSDCLLILLILIKFKLELKLEKPYFYFFSSKIETNLVYPKFKIIHYV